jgi:hypothetical protein
MAATTQQGDSLVKWEHDGVALVRFSQLFSTRPNSHMIGAYLWSSFPFCWYRCGWVFVGSVFGKLVARRAAALLFFSTSPFLLLETFRF